VLPAFDDCAGSAAHPDEINPMARELKPEVLGVEKKLMDSHVTCLT
jgi:hypothetical protein